MSALMSDVLCGKMTAQVTNAACNTVGKIIKIVELELQYGSRAQTHRQSVNLAFGVDQEAARLTDNSGG